MMDAGIDSSVGVLLKGRHSPINHCRILKQNERFLRLSGVVPVACPEASSCRGVRTHYCLVMDRESPMATVNDTHPSDKAIAAGNFE